MKIVLATNSNDRHLEFRNCKKFGDHSGYQTDLIIRSGGLALETPFYFEDFPLNQCIEDLSSMAETLQGRATLKPTWEEDYLDFAMLDLGHVAITGEFTRYSPYEQRFKFGFQTDQTIIIPLRDDLVRLSTLAADA